MRVERGISARKSRIQNINADISSVIAGLVGAAFAAILSLGTAVFRRKEEELAFA